jgi:CheY-like chemotaxis protein
MKTSKKVLVIDDCPFFLTTLRDALAVDYYVETASSGEEAIDILKASDCETPGYSEPFDLVITDLNMPGLSGYEVSGFVKGRNMTNNFTPVIMVSGSDLTKQEARNFVCTTYIPKSNLTKVLSMA